MKCARLRVLALIFCAWVFLGGPDVAVASNGTHVSGTIGSNTTWTLTGNPYILDGNVTVSSGATLTIDPGVVVKLNGQFRALTVDGTLNAVGTAGSRITFTSIQDDTVGGDSNGDGGATSGAAGQWFEIRIRAGTASRIEYADVRYGGYGSADTGYGAINVNGSSAAVTIENATISKNQRAGIRVYLGTATVNRTTIEQNAIGIAVNQGVINLGRRSYVRANTGDGLWFNLTSSYAGAASSIMDSDVRENGQDGIDLQVDRTLAVTKWPHGNRNNIFFNGDKQLKLSGYHPSSYIRQYNVDWSGNFWGLDVYYWKAPALCLGTEPYSPGHLAYRSSNPPPGPGGLAQPPDGPISWNTYIGGSGDNIAYCGYDRFLNLGECQFSSGYINSRYLIIMFDQPKPVDEALTCASQPGVRVVQLGSDSTTSCIGLHVGYIPEDDDPLWQITPDWEAFVITIVNELSDLGDATCDYVDSEVNQVVTSVEGYVDEVENLLNPNLFECQSTPWEPSSGRIETGPSSRVPGARFINQRFSWDAGSLLYLKTCGSTATFELDAVFNNYDGYHYFGRKIGFASNLPRRYNDTQAFDTTEEPVYTVGTADVQQLEPLPQEYFTLIRTAAGNASVDTGKVVSQLGVRLPAECYRPNCIFPMASTFRIPAWEYQVPGTMYWD